LSAQGTRPSILPASVLCRSRNGAAERLGRVPINRDRDEQRLVNVRFTPNSGHWRTKAGCLLWAISGHRALFDHLVGPGEQLRMNFEAKRVGGLEVFAGKGSGL
jgi:hypothetical protein